jgi:hypothetical protein
VASGCSIYGIEFFSLIAVTQSLVLDGSELLPSQSRLRTCITSAQSLWGPVLCPLPESRSSSLPKLPVTCPIHFSSGRPRWEEALPPPSPLPRYKARAERVSPQTSKAM